MRKVGYTLIFMGPLFIITGIVLLITKGNVIDLVTIASGITMFLTGVYLAEPNCMLKEEYQRHEKMSVAGYLARGRRELHDEYVGRTINTYLATGVMTPEEAIAYRAKYDGCYNGDCGFCQDVYKDLSTPTNHQAYG